MSRMKMSTALMLSSGKPMTMKTIPAQIGVGGVYRVLHPLQTRSQENAIQVFGRTCLNSVLPHAGHTLLTGNRVGGGVYSIVGELQ
jgi:hypothetical protein